MLLEVKELSKTFQIGKTSIQALHKVSFDIRKGKTLGLVGESGSGKSTIGFSIARLEVATSGEILLKGTDILKLNSKEFQKYRKQIQLVFQDPYASLNPRKTALETVQEAFLIHKLAKKKEAIQLSLQLLEKLGIMQEHSLKFPHELSGGQRQRVSIARALAVSPSLLVLDEPLSSLDVSVQAQIVDLLKNLQEENDLGFLFISHDLAMVKYFCHEVAVIYQGHLMEKASVEELFHSPLHPYTKLLIDSIPIPDPLKEKERKKLRMYKNYQINDLASKGCPFANRCPLAGAICLQEKPEWKKVGDNHYVACHALSLPTS